MSSQVKCVFSVLLLYFTSVSFTAVCYFILLVHCILQIEILQLLLHRIHLTAIHERIAYKTYLNDGIQCIVMH